MSQIDKPASQPPPLRMGPIAVISLYLAFAAVFARSLAVESLILLAPRYQAMELIFLLLFSAVFAFRRLPAWLLHVYFALQSALLLWMLSLNPNFDFLIVLYVMLSAQASLVFAGRTRWIWVAVFVLLSGGGLIYFLGAARGLSLSLTTIAAEILIPAYILVHHENELAHQRSLALLDELQQTNRRLQTYASQVEELAAMQERNRLARELHDTVSQLIFSISLSARSAQMLLEKDPQRLPEQLTRLKTMTGDALAQLRSLIIKLRPPQTP